MMIEVSSEQSRSIFRLIVLLPLLLLLLLCVAISLLLLQQQQCCCYLLLLVVVCRIAKFVAGSLNLIPLLSLSSLKRNIVYFMYPFAVSVAARRAPRFTEMRDDCPDLYHAEGSLCRQRPSRRRLSTVSRRVKEGVPPAEESFHLDAENHQPTASMPGVT